MTTIALFHAVYGIRQGVTDAADRLRAAGHDVRVVDQYDGRVFDDIQEAGAFAGTLGFPELMRRALDSVADLAEPFVVAGFSNGAGMAEYVAVARGGRAGGVLGSLQFSGALPLEMIGHAAWPPDTAVQLHYAAADPRRDDSWIDPFVASVTASGSSMETYLDYPGGHLFTDASLPDDFDAGAAELAFARAVEFLARVSTSVR
jgi:dienelactone hydrolase